MTNVITSVVYLPVKSSSKTSEQSGRDKLLIIKKGTKGRRDDESPFQKGYAQWNAKGWKKLDGGWRENDRSTTLADLKAIGLESKRASFFFFSFLRNTLDDEILALEREKENGPDPRDDSMITRNERTRPCQWTSLPFAPWSGEKRCSNEWRDLNYGNIVSLSVLRDVMDKYKYSGECEENLYDRA